jgi:hypothetical protein
MYHNPSFDVPASFVQWSYNQHFFAEQAGEQVIEHMLSLIPNGPGRNILDTQLRDELKHTALYRKILDRIGRDERANEFSQRYVKLIFDQSSLPEKIFCFQILTEAVSAGLCDWRLLNIKDPYFLAVDNEVKLDEIRHLKMGKCLLDICDRDQTLEQLTGSRQHELLKSMNEICRSTFGSYGNDESTSPLMQDMNRSITKCLVREYREINKQRFTS